MTENQTNQPSQPVDPNNQPAEDGHDHHVAGAHKKPKRGHFGSDGFAPRRDAVPPLPQSDSPGVEPAAQPKPAAGGFAAAAHKPVVSKTPKQPVAVKKPAPAKLPIDVPFEKMRLLALAVVMIPLCIWGSWQAWGSMVYEWYYTLDYGHGFFVIPLTAYFLYIRWDTYPGTRHKVDWVGLFPILFYGFLRTWAGMRYIDTLDAMAIFFWILGVVWFFYGLRVFLWALPSLCFLVFMFQLPWSYEMLMRNHLQAFAAQFAAVLLQMVGEAAIPIKNTIRLSTMELGVEAACSGIRFLISILAIALATVLFLRRPWWQNLFIMAVAIPLALLVNAMRIAMTGILLLHFNGMVAYWAKDGRVGVLADEIAGIIAIFIALFLFGIFVWYLGKVFRRVTI